MGNEKECKNNIREIIILGLSLPEWGLILGLIASFLTILDLTFKFGILNKLIQLFQKNSEWILWKMGVIYILVIVVITAVGLIWQINFLNNFLCSFRKNNKSQFFMQLTLSFIIIAILTVLLLWLFSYDKFDTREAEIIFPQAAKLGPTFIRTYASNGEAYYSFYDETPLNGPNGYVEITLQTYERTIKNNAGWIIFLLRGSDISGYKQLRFLIRGKHGDEIIGIKAKDAKGREAYLMLDNHYLREGNITTDWQEVSIPIKDFGGVRFDLIDNFSFFVDGNMAETRSQTILVGGFRLI